MLKATVSVGQIVVLSEVIVIVGVTFVFTTIVELALAVAGLVQPKLLVISTLITSPSTRPPLEYVVPVGRRVPLTDEVHTMVGVPPFPLTEIFEVSPTQITEGGVKFRSKGEGSFIETVNDPPTGGKFTVS